MYNFAVFALIFVAVSISNLAFAECGEQKLISELYALPDGSGASRKPSNDADLAPPYVNEYASAHNINLDESIKSLGIEIEKGSNVFELYSLPHIKYHWGAITASTVKIFDLRAIHVSCIDQQFYAILYSQDAPSKLQMNGTVHWGLALLNYKYEIVSNIPFSTKILGGTSIESNSLRTSFKILDNKISVAIEIGGAGSGSRDENQIFKRDFPFDAVTRRFSDVEIRGIPNEMSNDVLYAAYGNQVTLQEGSTDLFVEKTKFKPDSISAADVNYDGTIDVAGLVKASNGYRLIVLSKDENASFSVLDDEFISTRSDMKLKSNNYQLILNRSLGHISCDYTISYFEMALRVHHVECTTNDVGTKKIYEYVPELLTGWNINANERGNPLPLNFNRITSLYSPNQIVVDGLPGESDWIKASPALGYHKLYTVYGKSSANQGVDFAVRSIWDKDNINLYIEVFDSTLAFYDNKLSPIQYDHIEFWIGRTKSNASFEQTKIKDVARIGIVPTLNQNSANIYQWFPTESEIRAIEAKYSKIDKGIAYEIRIPSTFFKDAPSLKTRYRLTIVYSDSDSTPKQRALIATSDFKRGNTQSLGELVFVKDLLLPKLADEDF